MLSEVLLLLLVKHYFRNLKVLFSDRGSNTVVCDFCIIVNLVVGAYILSTCHQEHLRQTFNLEKE